MRTPVPEGTPSGAEGTVVAGVGANGGDRFASFGQASLQLNEPQLEDLVTKLEIITLFAENIILD